MRRLVIAALLVAAHAAPAAAQTVDEHLAKVRALYDQGDFPRAREELLAAYQVEPRPELLFALGQVELQLGNFQAAIERYEQFIATGPAPDQAALAQQAIGAARARLTEKPTAAPPPPPPPRPVTRRRWDDTNTIITTLGGVTLASGVGLVLYGRALGNDESGTLSRYDRRIDRAHLLQWVGAGCIAAGALAIGAAVLRWRIHDVEVAVQPTLGPSAAGVSWVGRW